MGKVHKKVIIIGGGFAGLNAAKRLGNKPFEVLVIDKTNHHLFQPLLYQVATAALSPADIARPIREVLSHFKNITVMMGHVERIEKDKKEIVFRNGDRQNYDYLIIATGAKHSYFGHDEWETFAPGVKTIQDALHIRERILGSFEKAERCDSIREARRFLNFVIIGGGPTGVEIAGAIAEIAYKTMLRNFRRIDTTLSKIYLIEGVDKILPTYPERLSKVARKNLESMGVIVKTGCIVSNVTKDGVYIGDEHIESRNVIWAAGNVASPLLSTLGAEQDKQGRVMVSPNLTLPDHPSIFVIGDAAYAKDKKGVPYPALAPVAVQQGLYAANTILGYAKKPFHYFDKGMMATIGKSKAVATIGSISFAGLFAWLLWCVIHIAYLIGFKKRFAVLMQWVFAYWSDQRGARLLNMPIEKDVQSFQKQG